MPDLEQRLRALGAGLDWPAPRDLSDAVRSRLPGRRPRSRRPLVLALAVLAVALAAALAVPRARTSILRLLHLGGVTVHRVDRLPPTRTVGPLRLGVPMSLAAAEKRLDRPIPLPDGERPDAIFVDDALAGGAVSLRYGPADRPRLLVDEFRTTDLPVIEKYVRVGDPLETVRVGGRQGLWIPRQHAALFAPLPARLAGSTLVWLRGDLTIRLEGGVTRGEALSLARSFRG